MTYRNMLDKWIIVYIEDVLMYSSSLEEQVHHVRSVLTHLVQYQLYTKVENCEFHQTSTSFLGYIISQEGVAMDKKSQGSVGLATPSDGEGVTTFPGVCKLLQMIC